MASSFFVLFDDIATTLDDVAAMTKVAAKKTSGVLGDDLALNAQQVSGVNADRELPVVWGVAKGSLVNKAILVPVALGLSAFMPGAIVPLLTVGGLYLCYEGGEKIYEKLFHHNHVKEDIKDVALSKEEIASLEKEKIKSAIKTDFILSAEVVAIALGTVTTLALPAQAITLAAVSVAMTVGVYGTVAAIVKMDDFGLHLMKKENNIVKKIGNSFVQAMPKLMKGLTFAGTAAMFTVGGSIVSHGLSHFGFNAIHHVTEGLNAIATMGVDASVGLAAGALSVGVMESYSKVKSFVKNIFKSENKVEQIDELNLNNDFAKKNKSVVDFEVTSSLKSSVSSKVTNKQVLDGFNHLLNKKVENYNSKLEDSLQKSDDNYKPGRKMRF